MCEQTEIDYLDGDVVWVKLGGCWWPGEVVGPEKLPPDVLPSFRKPPIAVVKFYQEDTYEYVKNLNSIYKYNCSRKNEFINKGLYMYRTKHGQMDKFPEDVIRAETAVGGDIAILTRDEFQEVKKESYAGLFGDPTKKTPASIKKGRSAMDRLSFSSSENAPTRKMQEKSNYKVHILVQGSKTSETMESVPSPSTSCAGSEPQDTAKEANEPPSNKEEKVQSVSTYSTPTMSSSGIYACHACQFTTTRLNVLIMHNKTHSATFTPYTPSTIKKKIISKTPKPSPNTTKTPKIRKPKQEKVEKPTKKKQGQKRAAEEMSVDETKKNKTDEEIKSSLLADWDDIDEESNDESTLAVMAGSPEVPITATSPAVPTPAELPCVEMPSELAPKLEKNLEGLPVLENPESVNDAKYEFREDEDWPVEADIGRKIPRVKNPSKRRDETKSIDEDEMAREVAELLNKTTLPELPSAPEPLKVEENFPEPTIVKSPDKTQDKPLKQNTTTDHKNSTDTQPPKTIFKTKTFFRSRHSRSQDAIGKYVAEQLNAAERMDMTDIELNGSEAVSSPEPPQISPPVEHVKVARLAPKIQLKKMKAEAAQLLEQEKRNYKKINDDCTFLNTPHIEEASTESTDLICEKDNPEKSSSGEQPHNKYDIQLEVVNTDNENSIVKEQDNTYIDRVIEAVPLEATNISQTVVKETETFKPFMNESTASAVDALLSVSRETDRVTKVVSDDPPEDLFEDDNKDSKVLSTVNGFSVESYEEKGQNESTISECSRQEPLKNATLVNSHDAMEIIQENYTHISPIVEEIKTQENLRLIADVATVKSITDENVTNYSSPDSELSSNASIISELIPTESVLQVAEALINLPTTSILNKTTVEPLEDSTEDNYSILNKTHDEHDQFVDPKPMNRIFLSTQPKVLVPSEGENLNSRFETEQEKCENLNAAQSLVEMSESIDLKINVGEVEVLNEEKKVNSTMTKVEIGEITSTSSSEVGQNVTLTASELNIAPAAPAKALSFQPNPSKLLKILEEPFIPKVSNAKKPAIAKKLIVSGKEKILNFDVGQSALKPKPAKQKIIIRRTTPTKNLLNNLNEITSTDKIILSPTNKSKQDVSAVQTYTIQTKSKVNTAEGNTIIIQPKLRKISKPVTKLQKIKHENSLVTSISDAKKDKSSTENIFDINSMPVVLSDDILTPESIEKMPIVMSDGNIITGNSNPPKLLKTKQTVVSSEKIPSAPVFNKTEVKTLLVNPTNEGIKVTTPNILSKSSKLRGAKPMLVIDKSTGKQKFIMTKSEQTVKEIKQSPSILQPAPQTTKTEKFIILPTPHSPRAGRTQKIVIDPQTGKAHVLVGKTPDMTSSATDNKPVSAKLIPSTSDNSTPGNTVMIITNAQGAQSRIVLTPEHEKILFPNKQQQNVTQLKQINHRPPNNGATPKTTISPPLKTQTRIVQKQKSAIITSKGQLIVGGRIATTTQNIAPLPEIRPAPKRIIATEPKKLVQAIQKTATEQLIFLQQKSGAVMQLTLAQFEHLKRTGQIIHKAPAQEKIVIQKSITIAPNETTVPTIQKTRARKHAADSHAPPKKVKHEIAIAPAPSLPIPALTPLTNTTPFVPPVSATTTISTTNYSELDNFEELLPSTAIARQPDPILQPEPPALPPPPAPVADGQLLAIPGENFGGPPGSFYLCVEDNGTLTPIDNRPLVLENNQLVPMAETLPVMTPQPERRDILEAALANSDVFHAEPSRDDAPDFRDLNANVSVHCRVSETSTTLHQPIMTPIEVPSKVDSEPTTVPSNLEDGLAVIGVTPHTIPTSLELPITVTDPRIAPKTTDPLRHNNYGPSLLPSPNTELTFATREDTSVSVVGPISMPLLTEDDSVGKSMPILTDDLADRTASLEETSIESPSSIEVRESELEDGRWPRRFLTPCSDTSDTSAEIPLQPALQLSASDLTQSS